MINGITSALSSLWTWIGIPGIPEIPEVSLGRISYLAEGGYVEKDHPMPVVIGDNKKEGEIVSPVSKMPHQDTRKEDECNPQRYPENLNLTQQYAHRYYECIQTNDVSDR